MLNLLADLTKSENVKSLTKYGNWTFVRDNEKKWNQPAGCLCWCLCTCKFSRLVCSSNQHLVALKS